jgi:hypothetical protein
MKLSDFVVYVLILLCFSASAAGLFSLLSKETWYYTPHEDFYKTPDTKIERRTHYHRELSCPLLLYEERDPIGIVRVVMDKDTVTLRKPDSTFEAKRERCPLCTKE